MSKQRTAIFALGLFLASFGAFRFLGSKQVVESTRVVSISPTPSPIQKTVVKYSELNKIDPSTTTKKFEDSLLNIQFNYPSKYFSQAYVADTKNSDAGIFFVKEKDQSKEEMIQYIVDCELENRKDPSGMCREGALRDVEVLLERLDDQNDVDQLEQCEIEKINELTTISACPKQLSVNPEDWGVEYAVVNKSPEFSKLSIHIRTRNPKEYADLIRSIVESMRVGKQ